MSDVIFAIDSKYQQVIMYEGTEYLITKAELINHYSEAIVTINPPNNKLKKIVEDIIVEEGALSPVSIQKKIITRKL